MTNPDVDEFPTLLEKLLVEEYDRTPEEAAALVKKHHRIVINAIMRADSRSRLIRNLRPAAMAIDLAENVELHEDPPYTIKLTDRAE